MVAPPSQRNQTPFRDYHAFYDAIAALRRKVILRMFLRGYWVTSIVSDLALLILLVLFPLSDSARTQIGLVAAFVLIPVVAAGLRCALTPSNDSEFAKLADERLDLRERVFTALELRDFSDSAYADLVMRDAVSALRVADSRSAISLNWDSIAAGVMLIVSLLLVTWHTPEVISSFILRSGKGGMEMPFSETKRLQGIPAPGEHLPTKVVGANQLQKQDKYTAAPQKPQPTAISPKPSAASKQSGSTQQQNGQSGSSNNRGQSGNGNQGSQSSGKSGSDLGQQSSGDNSSNQSIQSGQSGQQSTNKGQGSGLQKPGGSRSASGQNGQHGGAGQDKTLPKMSSGQQGQSSGDKSGSGSGEQGQSGQSQGQGSQSQSSGQGEGQGQGENQSQGQGRTNGNGQGQSHDRPLSNEDNEGNIPGSGGPGAPTGGKMEGQRTARIGQPAPVPKQMSQYSFRLPKPGSGETNIDEHPGNGEHPSKVSGSNVPSVAGQSSSEAAQIRGEEQDPQIPAGYRTLIKQYFDTQNR